MTVRWRMASLAGCNRSRVGALEILKVGCLLRLAGMGTLAS